MASSLVSGLTELFNSQLLGSVASQSGESESSVLRGFETTAGTLVAGLGSKVGQSGFARQLFDLVASPANDPRIIDNARSLVTSGTSDGVGSKLLSMVFGGEQSAITEAIGRTSGLRPGTAISLLSMAAPLLLGFLGKRVREGGMDASRLTSYLSGEADSIRGTLPSGIASLLGWEARTVPTVPPVASAVVRERSNRWVWPLVIALAVIAGLLWWSNSRRARVEPVQTAAAVPTDFVTRRLPNNVDLRIPADRMEDHLLVFIQDSSKPVDETTWFDFDRLLFDTNSATLQPGSQEQLRNVAAILTAYPNVHVKIGGYTDNTGDANANLRLSQARADAVKQQLIIIGISPDRMEAQGYGEQYPVGDNSTDEGRQRNRRISMRVTQK
ncbi:MAG: OmpA family protein [Acidobacteriaceae bacterium]|nr:OmpA family protein [Acidobacteriaceae bacterium]